MIAVMKYNSQKIAEGKYLGNVNFGQWDFFPES